MSKPYNPYAPSGPPAPLRKSQRLDPEIFQLPVEKMRRGYYSDKYFVRTREVLVAEGNSPVVTVQAFQKNKACVAGTDEAIAILKLCLTEGFEFGRDVTARALRDVTAPTRGSQFWRSRDPT